MSYDADIDLILAEGDDVFSCGGVTVAADFMEADQVIGADGQDAGVIQGRGYVLVKASLFPNVTTGMTATINGSPWRVVQKMRIQDGKIMQFWLGDYDG